MIRRSSQHRRQPAYRIGIDPKYVQYVSTARVWNLPPTLGIDARLDSISAFSKTGTIDVTPSPGGIGVKGDGSTGLYSRSSSVVPQAMWMAVQFVCNSVSITQKTSYALGSASSSLGAYCAIFSGNSTTSHITVQFRAVDTTGPVIGKVGPTPVVGTVYTVVAVYPSDLKADAYVYVNGVKYTTDYSSSADMTFTGANTLVNEAVGALKRGVTSLWTTDTVLFTARGLGRLPESLARQISLNPYSPLQEQQRNIYVGGDGAGSVTADASITQDGNTSTATSALLLAADASITASGDTAASASLLSIIADSSQTQASNTSSADSSLSIGADASITQDSNTLASDATLASDTITANASITQDDNTSTSAGALLLATAASITQAGDTTTSAGSLVVEAAASITQAGDTLTSAAAIEGITADASITQDDNSSTAAGTLSVVAAAAISQAGNTLSSDVITGAVVVVNTWSRNSFSLNGSALNGVALLPVAYGLVTGSAGASSSVAAVKTQFAQASASAGATATIDAVKTKYGLAAGYAGATAFVTSIQSHLARSSFSAGATGVAFVYNTRFAAAESSGTATGYAIANSSLGEVDASCLSSGSITPTRIHRAKSSVSASASGTADGIRTHYPLANISASCTATAEWQYKASGSSVWLHHGNVNVSAGGVLAVDETKYKVVVGNGFIATAESSGVANAYVEHHAIRSASCTATATASAIRTAYASMNNSGSCSGIAAAIKTRPGAVAATCSAIYSQTANSVIRTLSARSSMTGSATGIAIGRRYRFADSSEQCIATGWADGKALRMAEFNASASVAVTVTAFGNAGVHAPEDRTVAVPAEYRSMFVPFDNRTMRLTA